MAPPKILGKCSVCDMDATARGYCNTHYQLFLRWGEPSRPSEQFMVQRRLWRHISPEPNSGCWLWVGATAHYGHGRIVFRGRIDAAHRASWFAYRGVIPRGAMLCHKCNVPACVNPDHLYVGDAFSNARDRVAAGTILTGEKNPKAKLAEADVIAIRADTRTLRDIAKSFNVTDVLIGKIKRREIWRHLG